MTSRAAAERAAEDARGVGVNLLTLLAQAAFPAFHVQLARRLGSRGYGMYLWCEYVVDLFSLITLFGMDQAVQRRIATLDHDDRAGAARVVGTALRTVLLSGLAVGALLWVAAPWVGAHRHDPGVVAPLRALALKPTFYHVTSIFIVATQARGRMQYDFWTRGLAQPLALLVSTTAVLTLGGGVFATSAAVTVSIALTTALAATLFARDLPLRATLSAAGGGPVDAETLRTAWPLVLAGVVWAAQGRVEPLLLARWRSDADVAAFGVALLYVGSISQVRGIFAPVVMRHIPRALRDGKLDDLMATLRLQVRWSALLAAPLAVLFGGFAAPLLAVFGRDFSIGTAALGVLAIAHLVNACALAAYVIPMSGRGHYSMLTALLAILFQLAVLPILIPRYGLTGAAVGAALGLAGAQVVQGAFAWRIARVHGFSWGLAKVLGSALLALAAGRTLYHLAPASWAMVWRFALGISTAAVVYVATVVALGLEPEERALLRGALARVRSALRRGGLR